MTGRPGGRTSRRRFNDPEDPLAFLIVTAKLLTGFDAPIEQVMYLDRPLRRHTLFQAITRTNRRFTHPPTGQEKTSRPDRGLHRPGQADRRRAEGRRPGHRRQAPCRRGRASPPSSRPRIEASPCRGSPGSTAPTTRSSTLQAAIQRLADTEATDAFAPTSPPSTTLWEFLDPHEVLDAHRADYKWLAQVYEAIKPTKTSNALLWHRLGAKTLALVHGNITDVTVTGTGLEEVVVDPDAIEAMRTLVEQGELDLDLTGTCSTTRSPSMR